MHRLLGILVASTVVLAACGGGGAVATGGTVDGELAQRADGTYVSPDFSFTLADGTDWRLADQTTPTVLAFWADWCTVCRRDLPALDAVAADYDGEISFLAVAGLGTPSLAAERADEYFASGVVEWGYDADEDLWALFGARGTPTYVFLGTDGSVLGIQPGALPADKAAVLDQVVELGA